MAQKPLDATDVTTLRAVRIPERIDSKLRNRAELEGRTISEVLREALVAHLDRKASPAA